jgi:hypothetical protein
MRYASLFHNLPENTQMPVKGLSDPNDSKAPEAGPS